MVRYILSLLLLGGVLAPVAAQAQNYDSRREVTCESNDGRYRECRTSFNAPAQIVRQLSDTRCVEGRNWGSRPGLIWVDEGCRARFAAARQGWPSWSNSQNQREVTCESRDERYRQCNTGFRGQARIVRQLSQNPCIEGRTWGQERGMVWVSRGCRARFEDTGWGDDGYRPGQAGYQGDDRDTVRCESTDDRRRACAWNTNWGRPRLVQQLSNSACIEGRSWGYGRDNSGREMIWVDDGCRARFAGDGRRRY